MEPIEPSEDQERPPRQGWEDHSKQMAAEGEDKLLDADSLSNRAKIIRYFTFG